MSVKLNAGNITFRHSVVKDSSGKYGLPCFTSVKKLSPTEQGAVLEELERLQTEKPKTQPEWCGPLAWKIWGSKLVYLPPTHLKEVRGPHGILDEVVDGDYEAADKKESEELLEKALKNKRLERHFKDIIAKKDKRIKDLEALLDQYANAAGLASDEEKTFTLQDAYIWGIEFMIAKSETATKNKHTKMMNLCELLGPDTKWPELNARMLDDAIESRSDIWAYATRVGYRDAASWWFTGVKQAMKFRHDPTEGLVVGSPSTGAASEDKTLIDPREAVKKVTDEKIKLLVSICGFAGLRLSEALRLDWADFELPLIQVKQQKNNKGKRYAYAFSNLKNYLPKKLPASGPLFEGMHNYDACSAGIELLGPKPFNSLRHWHATQMAKDKDLRDLESIANGHSKKVAATHYQDIKSLLLSVGSKSV